MYDPWLRQARENEVRREVALALRAEIATFLRSQGARRAWLFGSLAWGKALEWNSDIDVAGNPGRASPPRRM
jgi:predicted nucleotidyltransferase